MTRIIHQIDNRPAAERIILIVYRVDAWSLFHLVTPTRATTDALQYDLLPGYYKFKYQSYRNGAWRTVDMTYYRIVGDRAEPVSATTVGTALWGSSDPWRGMTPLIVTEDCGCDRLLARSQVVRLCPDHRLEVAVENGNDRADRLALVDALDLVDGAPIDGEPSTFLTSLGYARLASGAWRTPDGRLIQ